MQAGACRSRSRRRSARRPWTLCAQPWMLAPRTSLAAAAATKPAARATTIAAVAAATAAATTASACAAAVAASLPHRPRPLPPLWRRRRAAAAAPPAAAAATGNGRRLVPGRETRCRTHERNIQEMVTVRWNSASACISDCFDVSRDMPDHLPTPSLVHDAIITDA
eukprot:2891601-Pyramimonas_sp.AAC.1